VQANRSSLPGRVAASSVKLTPPLKNDWVTAAHTGDPDPAVIALPNTAFGFNGPVLVLLKGSGTAPERSPTA